MDEEVLNIKHTMERMNESLMTFDESIHRNVIDQRISAQYTKQKQLLQHQHSFVDVENEKIERNARREDLTVEQSKKLQRMQSSIVDKKEMDDGKHPIQQLKKDIEYEIEMQNNIHNLKAAIEKSNRIIETRKKYDIDNMILTYQRKETNYQNEISNLKKDMDKKVKEKQAELKSIIDELAHVKTENAQMYQNMIESQEESKSVLNELQKQIEKNSKMEREITRLNEELEKAKEESNMKSSLNELTQKEFEQQKLQMKKFYEQTKIEQKKEVDQLMKKIKDLEEAKQQSDKAKSDKDNIHEKEIESYKKEIIIFEHKVKQLEHELQEKEEEKENIMKEKEKEIQLISQSIIAHHREETSMKMLKNESDHQKEMQQLKNKILECHTEYNKLKTELDSKVYDYFDVSTKLILARNEIQEKNDEIQEIKEDYSQKFVESESEVIRLENELQEIKRIHETHIKKSEKESKERSSQVEGLQSDLNKALMDIEKERSILRKALGDFDAKKKEQEQIIALMVCEKEEFSKSLKSSTKEVESMRKEIVLMEQKYRNLAQENAFLKDQIKVIEVHTNSSLDHAKADMLIACQDTSMLTESVQQEQETLTSKQLSQRAGKQKIEQEMKHLAENIVKANQTKQQQQPQQQPQIIPTTSTPIKSAKKQLIPNQLQKSHPHVFYHPMSSSISSPR